MLTPSRGNREAPKALADAARRARARFLRRWTIGVGLPTGIIATVDRVLHRGGSEQHTLPGFGYILYALVTSAIVTLVISYLTGELLWRLMREHMD